MRYGFTSLVEKKIGKINKYRKIIVRRIEIGALTSRPLKCPIPLSLVGQNGALDTTFVIFNIWDHHSPQDSCSLTFRKSLLISCVSFCNFTNSSVLHKFCLIYIYCIQIFTLVWNLDSFDVDSRK